MPWQIDRRLPRKATEILGWTLGLVVLVVFLNPSAVAPASPSRGEVSSFATVPAYNVVNFTSSVDGTNLSYYEWLPNNFSNASEYPLAVYLHGLGYQGSEIITLAGGLSAIAAAQADGFILISLNTRTGGGFYVNSPYTGPQQQDVLDAITHEKTLREVSQVYLFGSSMGSIGTWSIAANVPGLVSGIGGIASCPDVFEAIYWHYLEIPGGYTAYVQTTGGNGPNSTYFRAQTYYLSAARFYPQNFSNISMYTAQGGNDPDCPDNPNVFGYQQANNTFLNSTCLVVVQWNEPANCQTPFSNLSLIHPGEYRWRLIYSATGGHSLNELNGADLFGFWAGTVPHGLACAREGQTPGPCPTKSVTFRESGLSGGTWNVTVDGVTLAAPAGTPILFNLVTGPHSYAPSQVAGYRDPTSGTLVVLGNALTMNVSYTRAAWNVTFTESMLSQGAFWGVSINGQAISTNASSLEIALPNGTYEYEVATVPGFVPTANENVTVDGSSISVPIQFIALVPYPVTFSETGLSSGDWNVTVLGATQSAEAGASIQYNLTNGSYPYEVVGPSGEIAPPAGNVSVNGSPVSLSVAFRPEAPQNVTFVETGLPAGTSWNATLNGTTSETTSTTSSFVVPDGVYVYSIGAIPGYLGVAGGKVTVDGAPLVVAVAFDQVTYNLSFVQSGLPPGTSWGITIESVPWTTSNQSLELALPNGTYPYSVDTDANYTAKAGTATVNGSSVSVPVAFSAMPTYTVTFTQSGLPLSTGWGITIAGSTHSGSGASIIIALVNGSYTFAPVPVAGYSNSSGGPLVVAGSSLNRNVAYTKLVTYATTFTESGLPAGTAWNVTIGSTTLATVGTSIKFSLTDGTHPYKIGPPSGFATKASGSVTINGKTDKVTVTFKAVKYAVTFSETGLSTGTKWQIKLGASTVSSKVSTIVFSLTNGSYAYGLVAVVGYVTPANGTIVVTGSALSVAVGFVKIKTYAVKLTESGLPAGTSWAVTINGQRQSTTGTYITFNLANGTYAYSVASQGFRGSPANGTFAVSGKPVSLSVAFTLLAAPRLASTSAACPERISPIPYERLFDGELRESG